MRYLFTFMCVLALAVTGCSETSDPGGSGGDGGASGNGGEGGAGGDVTQAVEEMLVGRWWLNWDQAAALTTRDGIALATLSAEGWANYDIILPNLVPTPIPEWCRRYATWSVLEVVAETEFTYELSYTGDACNRLAGTVERFAVVLDQTDPPKGEVTRLSEPDPSKTEISLPIERCTTDISASEACGFETGLGPPTQNPPL